MLKKFELDTSGVLVIVSKNALKNTFAEAPFSYDFPEGILPLLNNGTIMAVVTESGEDVKGRLLVDAPEEDTSKFTLLGAQKLNVSSDDEIVLLGHSEFTQICSSRKGDIDAFKFWNPKTSLSKVPVGWYTAQIYVRQPKNSHLLHFIIVMNRIESAPNAENHIDVLRF